MGLGRTTGNNFRGTQEESARGDENASHGLCPSDYCKDRCQRNRNWSGTNQCGGWSREDLWIHLPEVHDFHKLLKVVDIMTFKNKKFELNQYQRPTRDPSCL